MPVTPPDEILVAWLKSRAPISGVIGTRVFHLEVFQESDSQSRYPCIVYEQADEDIEQEMHGIPEFSHISYTVTLISKRSAQLRAMMREIKKLALEVEVDAVSTANDNVSYVTVQSDSEFNEFASEQQELGYKTAQLTIIFDIWTGVP